MWLSNYIQTCSATKYLRTTRYLHVALLRGQHTTKNIHYATLTASLPLQHTFVIVLVDVALLGGQHLVGEGAAVHEARDQIQRDGRQVHRHQVPCVKECVCTLWNITFSSVVRAYLFG